MSKFIDMTGERIGSFTVIQRVENSKSGLTRWLCQCDCGNSFECNAGTLRRKEHPISCPKCALELKHLNNAKDLTGKVFGRLRVVGVEKDGDNHYKQKCQCECGNTILVRPYFLIHGDITSCGCHNPFINANVQSEFALSRIKDLSNKKYGSWTPLEYNSDLHKWKCKCDCGNISYITTSNLKRGLSKSCGCLKANLLREKTLIDISGEKYGKLTALYPIFDEEKNISLWMCQCDCGAKIAVRSGDLKSGRQLSCGCLKSKGELLIKQYLIKNNITYQSQKTFNELTGIGNKSLSYDFFLPDYNLLIEFQGEQHYAPYEIFGGIEHFEKQKEHDKRKREYAKSHKYELLEIKYTDKSNIDSILSNILNL